MGNNEIIQIINKLRKFTHNPNEYYPNEDIIKFIKENKHFSLGNIFFILRQCKCIAIHKNNDNSYVIDEKNELLEVFNKAIQNYVVKTIITTLKNIAYNDTAIFENIEKRILRNIKLNGKTCNNIEELLNELYKKEISVEDVFCFIGRNIHWIHTIEGYDYWRSINAKLKQEYYSAIIQKPMNIIDKNVLFEIVI